MHDAFTNKGLHELLDSSILLGLRISGKTRKDDGRVLGNA